MAKVYQCFNGAGPTTAAPVAITTGTSVKTMIQLATATTKSAQIVEWWWEGGGSAAATPAVVEVMFHSSGAATVTGYTAATDFKKYEPNAPASLLTVGVTASGFTASGEGTPATALGSIVHMVPVTSGMYVQYPLGREPEFAASTLCRLRNTVTPAVNATCGFAWEE